MSAAISTTRPTPSTSRRWLLFAAAVTVGILWGYVWSIEASLWAYSVLLGLFADENMQIASLVTGVGIGFVLGFVHIAAPCYLPAALAAMPLSQVARTNREWFQTVAVLAVCMVAVTAAFGAIVGAPTSLLAGVIGSRRTVSLIMQTVLGGTGLLMIAIAMGELGLIRRLLPEVHLAPSSATPKVDDRSLLARYRSVSMIGLWIAATFGIICPKPLYLALLVYVAVVGSMAYGALVLSAYGLGLATSIGLGGFILLRASRAARFSGWLATHEGSFHLVQGVVFAVLGVLTVAFWGFRYPLPPA
jgi:cytochrome c biogenesis protein CcdA